MAKYYSVKITSKYAAKTTNDASKKCNLMTRDYWFDRKRTEATSIYTSSFCVIHEITEPLDPGQN